VNVASDLPCPLCGGIDSEFFAEDRQRQYLRCPACALVFVPPRFHLDPAREKAEYDLHQNNPADPGYRRFLSRLCQPLCERLPGPSTGLDFGCGPGPTLSLMLEEAGHEVALYDPFYAPDPGALKGRYGFITASEVVEHLVRPGRELARLWELLEPGGYLGVMTGLVRDVEAFRGWRYKDDLTHICFFSRATWHWWARRQGAELELPEDGVILLRRVR